MDDFDNLSNNNIDPLADIEDQLNQTKIHIRIQKRNARKHICTVEGLEMDKTELKNMIKGMKKKFACNGNLVNDDKLGFVIQLQGDMRDNIKQYLIDNYSFNEDCIITHGYD